MFQQLLHVLGQFLVTFSKLQSASLHQAFLSWHRFPSLSFVGPVTPAEEIYIKYFFRSAIFLCVEKSNYKSTEVRLPLIFKSCTSSPIASSFSSKVSSISSILNFKIWNSRLKFLFSLISSSNLPQNSFGFFVWEA